jgi:hypothetical protein
MKVFLETITLQTGCSNTLEGFEVFLDEDDSVPPKT